MTNTRRKKFFVNVFEKKVDVILWEAMHLTPGFISIIFIIVNYFFFGLYMLNAIGAVMIIISSGLVFYKYYANTILQFDDDCLIVTIKGRSKFLKWNNIKSIDVSHKEPKLQEAFDLEINSNDESLIISITRYKFERKKEKIISILNNFMLFPHAENKVSVVLQDFMRSENC